ncbi:MAG: DUF2949 domain-containing protein [Cyanobacteria bacterium P01_F01_bin.42]
MNSPRFIPIIDFLQRECHLSSEAIAIAFRRPLLSVNQVPIALWQLGLISLDDVARVFDWLERSADSPAYS